MWKAIHRTSWIIQPLGVRIMLLYEVREGAAARTECLFRKQAHNLLLTACAFFVINLS